MVPKLRPVDLEDLLGRPSVALDIESIAGYIANHTVMVTGAGVPSAANCAARLAGINRGSWSPLITAKTACSNWNWASVPCCRLFPWKRFSSM